MQDLLRTNRIKELFSEALNLDEAGRTALFSRAVADDPSIEIELRSLISAHSRARDFLRESEDFRPAPDAADLFDPPSFGVGDRVDRYTLLEKIGEGGFGSVYRAQQHEPVKRSVALKVIQSGMGNRQVIARFEAERQALAVMDHPGIAKVHDAGVTGEGHPFFVMELIEGAPITRFCDDANLSITQRLRLFQDVCAAVQHAHNKGVIHRDLKPGNILVGMRDGKPHARIIDFGIARAIASPTDDTSRVTESRQMIGTPEYMSPEQAELGATDIDTRSDVYALGVLLYELLTGVTPIDGKQLRAATFSEMQGIIREREPLKPSARLASIDDAQAIAACRSTEPRRLIAALEGDLDWITLKALRKDREQRYNSPADLAEDIRRHLAHEPVLAGPLGAGYRVRKFIQRHRAGVLAGTAAAIALVAGTILAVGGMMRAEASAERERAAAQEAIAVSDFLRIVLTSTNPERMGADVRMSEALDAASEMVNEQFADHPLIEAQVRDVLASAYGRLSLWQGTIKQSSVAVDLWKRYAGLDDRRTVESMMRLAEALAKSSRTAEAQRVLDEIFPHLGNVFDESDERSFGAHLIQAEVLWLQGRLPESVAVFRRLMARAEELQVNEVLQVRLLGALTNASRLHVDEMGTPDAAALKEYEQSAKALLERSRNLGPDAQLQTLNALQNLANVAFLRGDYQQAVIQFRHVLGESRERWGECHSVRKWAMGTYADALRMLERHAEAADVYLRLVECTRASSGSDSPALISTLSDAQIFMECDQRWDLAEAFCRETIDAITRMGGHSGTLYLECRLAHFVSNQAGRHDEAEALFQKLLARDPKTISPGTLDWLHLFYADHLTRAGEFERAERLLRSIETSNDLNKYGFTPRMPNDLQYQFILLYRAWGKPDKVEEYQRILDQRSSMMSPIR